MTGPRLCAAAALSRTHSTRGPVAVLATAVADTTASGWTDTRRLAALVLRFASRIRDDRAVALARVALNEPDRIPAGRDLDAALLLGRALCDVVDALEPSDAALAASAAALAALTPPLDDDDAGVLDPLDPVGRRDTDPPDPLDPIRVALLDAAPTHGPTAPASDAVAA